MSLMDAADKAFTSYENKIAKLEADNAKLRTEVERLKIREDEVIRANVAEEEAAKLRARLALAEAVCEAADFYTDTLGAHHHTRCGSFDQQEDRCLCGVTQLFLKLAAWQKGKT